MGNFDFVGAEVIPLTKGKAMLDLKFIRENADLVRQAIKNKNEKTDVDLILSLDENRRSLLTQADELKHQKNVVSDKIASMKKEMRDVKGEIENMREVSDRIDSLDAQLKDLDEKIKQKTKELLESNIELTKTKRMKSEFVGMINHELKSPITAVLSGVEVIKARGTKKFDESQHKLLDIIERSGQEMLRLTNDFLDISKVESGKIEIYPEHVPFADLLEEVIQSLKPEAKRKKIKIDAKFDKSISTVYADPVRLKQVMFNLVDNAIKYTGESGTVSITAVAFDNQVKIEVKDTGIGIKRESLSQIFDRFTKHVAGYKGTGLGLYIAKSFTEAHGGRIEVESTLGQGSTFRIFLPKGPAA